MENWEPVVMLATRNTGKRYSQWAVALQRKIMAFYGLQFRNHVANTMFAREMRVQHCTRAPI
jgi:hypothetical protein